jgi:AcrR family transcriptional regulator
MVFKILTESVNMIIIGLMKPLSNKTQQSIINAAVKIFAELKYEKASMGDIAKAANVSKPLLFHYYQSKRILYQACITFAQTQTQLLMKSLKHHDHTFKMIQDITKAKLRLSNQYPGILKLLNEASRDKQPSQPPSPFQPQDLALFKANVSPKVLWNLLYFLSLGLSQAYVHEKDTEAFFQNFDDIFKMLSKLVMNRRITHATRI